MCSFTAKPAPTQAITAIGNRRASTATVAKVLDVQPPHLRYHPNAKVRLTTHAVNRLTPIQSIRSGSGWAGRSGLTKRRTRGIANRAKGTFTQKTQRHDSASLTNAVKSGVVGRVE